MTAVSEIRQPVPDEIGFADNNGVRIGWRRYGDGPHSILFDGSARSIAQDLHETRQTHETTHIMAQIGLRERLLKTVGLPSSWRRWSSSDGYASWSYAGEIGVGHEGSTSSRRNWIASRRGCGAGCRASRVSTSLRSTKRCWPSSRR